MLNRSAPLMYSCSSLTWAGGGDHQAELWPKPDATGVMHSRSGMMTDLTGKASGAGWAQSACGASDVDRSPLGRRAAVARGPC